MSDLSKADRKDFMGLEGFVWFYGVVENRKDPLFLGRVKVRCIGFHTDDKSLIPTGDLPWADVIQPVTSAAISGIGTTPTGLVEGTHVFGFFRDGREAQEPVILGTSGGIPENIANPDRGFNDPRTINERKSAPYPPFYIDRFTSGIPAKVIEHGQTDETPEHYDFVGETPMKGGRIWFGKNKDESKIQANIFKRSGAGSPGSIAALPDKVDNPSLMTSQIYSRHPDENRVIFDKNGIPIMSLPSTTLLGLNRIKFIQQYNAHPTHPPGFTGPPGRDYEPRSTSQPQSQIEMQAHRITGGLTAAQTNLHTGIRKANGAAWDLPKHPFNPEYPYNHVTYTESGHLFELDDSPGGERVRLLHRTQSFLEFLPDGSRVDNTVGKSYSLCDSDAHSHIYGDEIKHVEGSMNHVYNSRSGGCNHLLFEGDGDVNMDIRKGNYNVTLDDGDMVIKARNLKIIGNAKGQSKFKLQQMEMAIGDETQKSMQKGEALLQDFGDVQLTCGNYESPIAGNSKTNIGANHEFTVVGSSKEVVSGLLSPPGVGGMKKMCTTQPITLEATTPAMPIKLHSGPGGTSSSLELSIVGMVLNTKFGNVVTEAKIGSIAQTAGTNFTVDAGTEIEFKNKNGNIKIDTTGFISMKGSQSDIHTLLKKLSMALQNMTFPTPAGPSSVATNMSEFTGFDAEIDKVFKK
jgi:hypothetical protein